MAARRRTGKVIDLTTQVLIDIREELRRGFAQVDARFAQVDARFAQVDARFAQVDARFDQVNGRLDNLIDLAGDRYRDLDARLRVLESRDRH